MTAETRHPLAGTKQPCPVCGGMYLVHEWGALEAHNIKRETWWIETCSGAREILPVPEPASAPPAETPKFGPDLTWCIEGIAESAASLGAMIEQALPKLAAGLAPAPVPSGVDDLRDRIAAAPASSGTDSLALRIAAAIVEAGTGDAMRGVYDKVTIAAAPADLADAVMAVVGPELARRDAETPILDRAVDVDGDLSPCYSEIAEIVLDYGTYGNNGGPDEAAMAIDALYRPELNRLCDELDRRNTEIAQLQQRLIDERNAEQTTIRALAENTRRAGELRAEGAKLAQQIEAVAARAEQVEAERDRLAAENQQLRQFVDGVTQAVRPEVPAERGETT